MQMFYGFQLGTRFDPSSDKTEGDLCYKSWEPQWLYMHKINVIPLMILAENRSNGLYGLLSYTWYHVQAVCVACHNVITIIIVVIYIGYDGGHATEAAHCMLAAIVHGRG